MSDTKGFHIGIDAGSVSLNGIVITGDREIVYEAPYCRHMGKVEEGLVTLLEDLYRSCAEERVLSVSFTGNHGRNLSRRFHAFFEFETISQVLGAIHLVPGVRSILSMGGQDTALLQVRHDREAGSWDLEYFNTNGPCAAGTGSFIDQQAQRLATSLYAEGDRAAEYPIDAILQDFISLGSRSLHPADVACRCTVFTKSDMIHLQNKGERLEDIIYGLHVGTARNYMSTIVSNRTLEDPMVFIGGLSLNTLQVKAFQQYFPTLVLPPHRTSVGALGVAIQAIEQGIRTRIGLRDLKSKGREIESPPPAAPPLLLKKTAFPEDNVLSGKKIPKGTRVFLGIDIGSTTTKYALIDEGGTLLHKRYVPTQGKPIEVTQGLMAHLEKAVGDRVEIVGTATTGSGRHVVGDFLNVDLILDEITAHAKGAVEIDPEVDTIFEIGGQDSKYISISGRYPTDFDMNKVCAAGTGSFLHELANKYGINIVEEFQRIALGSRAPVKLAERCTVFMESDLVSYHQQGVARDDLIAGLCYAIVSNYLNRVVGKRKIGKRVMFLGGPSLNKGVVAAFEDVLGRALVVPRHREVLGAFGAAVAVRERMGMEGGAGSRFRGLDSAIGDRMAYTERICRADPGCHNQCKLKIYDFDGRKSVWGGECGRYEIQRGSGERKEDAFSLYQTMWDTAMAGMFSVIGEEALLERDGRPTVGMQRSLYGHVQAVFWAHFFEALGFHLCLSPPTTPSLAQAGVERVLAETCFPVKVSHGHVQHLMGKTRFLFMPSPIDMPSPVPSERGFFCPMVQSNSYMARMALFLDPSEVLSPVVHFRYDSDTLAIELGDQLAARLGVKQRTLRDAVHQARAKEARFQAEVLARGEAMLADHPEGDPLVMVTGRPYNLHDERVNLRLGRQLAKIGLTAFPMDFMDVSHVDLSDFPSMYWGLGARILRTAKRVSARHHYFGLHLTNFGCGADSFIEHFYKHIMGTKPYLILELDEHSAVAGVMTRLEAFRNVLEHIMEKAPQQRMPSRKLAN